MKSKYVAFDKNGKSARIMINPSPETINQFQKNGFLLDDSHFNHLIKKRISPSFWFYDIASKKIKYDQKVQSSPVSNSIRNLNELELVRNELELVKKEVLIDSERIDNLVEDVEILHEDVDNQIQKTKEEITDFVIHQNFSETDEDKIKDILKKVENLETVVLNMKPTVVKNIHRKFESKIGLKYQLFILGTAILGLLGILI